MIASATADHYARTLAAVLRQVAHRLHLLVDSSVAIITASTGLGRSRATSPIERRTSIGLVRMGVTLITMAMSTMARNCPPAVCRSGGSFRHRPPDALRDREQDWRAPPVSSLRSPTIALVGNASGREGRLQKLIFPEGLSFDGESLGTPATALIFSALRLETVERVGLVEQLRGNWNSVVAKLSEILGLGSACSGEICSASLSSPPAEVGYTPNDDKLPPGLSLPMQSGEHQGSIGPSRQAEGDSFEEHKKSRYNQVKP